MLTRKGDLCDLVVLFCCKTEPVSSQMSDLVDGDDNIEVLVYIIHSNSISRITVSFRMYDTNVCWYILSGINLNCFLSSHIKMFFSFLNSTHTSRQNLGIADGFWLFSSERYLLTADYVKLNEF